MSQVARVCGGARPSAYRPVLIGAGGSSVPIALSAAPTGMRQWCTDTQDQLGSQCVGEMLANAHWIAKRNQGRRASHRGIYFAARARERLRRGDAVPDIGCDPADAIDSLVSVGIYPLDARDNDPAALNEPETWPEAIASKLFKVDDFQPINDGDTDTIDHVLASDLPVGNWMPVDQAFMNWYGPATWPGLVGPSIGGHATVIVDRAPNGDYIIWNSWGLSWGANGFATVARKAIAERAGLCAVLGGPTL